MTKTKAVAKKVPAKKPVPFGLDRWIVTQARYLRMLSHFTGKEEACRDLSGIYIEPVKQGILLVATNGWQLGVIHDAAGSAKAPFICPVSKDAVARKTEAGALAVFSGNMLQIVPDEYRKAVKGPKTAIRYGIYHETLPAIDSLYPDWRRVLPDGIKPRLRPMSLNARLVADFAKVTEGAGVKSAGFNFYQSGGNTDPVIVRTPEVPEFFGLLMPMRVFDTEPLPAWLPKKKSA